MDGQLDWCRVRGHQHCQPTANRVPISIQENELTLSFALFLLVLQVCQVLEKEVACEASKNHSYLDLVKTPQLRKITLLSGLFW